MTAASRSRDLRRALESLMGVPATEGNRVDVLRNGDQIFPAMLEEIRAAQHSIDLATFVYWTGDIAVAFATALAERAAAGVRVRVLLDAVGARRMNSELIERMTDAGADVRWFRPIGDVEIGEVQHRTHRKILVCDERVGFTGGVGIAEEWMGDARHPGEWRDTHLRVEGPAVDGLRASFVDNWIETGDRLEIGDADRFPVPGRPGDSTIQVISASAAVKWNQIATLMDALLSLAEERVLITTAYFNPDERLQNLLLHAAARGVEVDVLLPGPHADKRFVQLASEGVYQCLLDGGVRINCFQPTMLHAKVITVDRALAVVGSANMNNRSMIEDDEVVLVITDPDIVAVLDGDRAGDMTRAVALDPDRWADRPIRQRAKEALAGVFEDFL